MSKKLTSSSLYVTDSLATSTYGIQNVVPRSAPHRDGLIEAAPFRSDPQSSCSGWLEIAIHDAACPEGRHASPGQEGWIWLRQVEPETAQAEEQGRHGDPRTILYGMQGSGLYRRTRLVLCRRDLSRMLISRGTGHGEAIPR